MLGVRVEDEVGDRRLREIELPAQIAELLHVLPNRRTGIGPSHVLTIQSLAVQEPILDELEIRIEGQRLRVDVQRALDPRTDYERGDPKAVPSLIDDRGNDVVVEPAPVVPGHE